MSISSFSPSSCTDKGLGMDGKYNTSTSKSCYKLFKVSTPDEHVDLDPAMFIIVHHASKIGLHMYQDASNLSRIMFDGTEFNKLGGYTTTKGIKGDFLARMKRKITEAMG
jgi:hypothetical protein